MSNAKRDYSYIRQMNDYCGLLGFVIAESAGEYGNSYEDIGRGVDYVINKYPDQVDLIEEVIIGITGYSFATIREKMKENKEYYEAL